MKWATGSTNTAVLRQLLIADVLRVASIQATNSSSKFLILGGRHDKIAEVFSDPNVGWASKKGGKKVLQNLFSTDLAKSEGIERISEIVEKFEKVKGWLPINVPATSKMLVKTQLLADAKSTLGTNYTGRVLVWQYCSNHQRTESTLR